MGLLLDIKYNSFYHGLIFFIFGFILCFYNLANLNEYNLLNFMLSLFSFLGVLLFARYLAGGANPKLTPGLVAGVRGKTVIITGANSGVGKACAIYLVKIGVRVILACRNKRAGEQVEKEINTRFAQVGGGRAVFMECDLASLTSVTKFARMILLEQQHSPVELTGLICNAGVMVTEHKLSKDQFELEMAVCHLGHYVLSRMLYSQLAKNQARIVMVVLDVLYFAITLLFYNSRCVYIYIYTFFSGGFRLVCSGG